MRRRASPLLVPALLAIVLLAASGSASAEVAEIPFGKLVVLADEILVGRVLLVLDVPVETTDEVDDDPQTVPLALVQALEWLKGEPRPRFFWVWGYGTWICDVTHFTAGERALLFLDRGGVADLVTPASFDRLRKATRGEPIRRVAWSGRGRMPLLSIAGRAHAGIWSGEIRLPSALETLPGHDPRYAAFRRFVPLDALRTTIRRQVAELERPRKGTEGLVFQALRRLCDVYIDTRWEEAHQALERAGPAGIAVLWQILGEPDSPLHSAATAALDPYEDDGERLMPALTSEDVAQRRAAARAFEAASWHSWGWSDGVEDARDEAARDPDPEVRRRILRALARDRTIDALPQILAGLRDDSLENRRQAALALRPVAYLADERPAAERKAAEALLLALGEHEQVRLRRAAWETLAEYATAASEKATFAALEDPDSIVRMHAVCTLARFESAESRRVLIALLGHADAWIRRAAAYALGTAKYEAALPQLIKALADKDDGVGALAAWALGELGPKAAAALPALRAIVKRGGDSKRHYDAREALHAIENK